MLENREYCIGVILSEEGGLSNNPRDPGGLTNRGITYGVFKDLHIDINGDGVVNERDLKLLSEEDARKIYRHLYWDKIKGDQLPAGIDLSTLDFSVNSGVSKAVMTLQHTVNAFHPFSEVLAEDGELGPLTQTAVNTIYAAHPAAFIEDYNNARLVFLKNLSHWPDFKNGWSNRVKDIQADSLRSFRTGPI